MLSLIQHVYEDVKFDAPVEEPDLLRDMKRVDTLNTACHFGYEDCVRQSVNNYQLWMLEANPELNNPLVMINYTS